MDSFDALKGKLPEPYYSDDAVAIYPADWLNEPTPEECSKKSKVLDTDCHIGYACWFPQMGGYAGKCVAVFDKQRIQHENGSAEGGCIELYVWHDGEFPFTEEAGEPKHIHICSPEEFITFGKFLSKVNTRNR